MNYYVIEQVQELERELRIEQLKRSRALPDTTGYVSRGTVAHEGARKAGRALVWLGTGLVQWGDGPMAEAGKTR